MLSELPAHSLPSVLARFLFVCILFQPLCCRCCTGTMLPVPRPAGLCLPATGCKVTPPQGSRSQTQACVDGEESWGHGVFTTTRSVGPVQAQHSLSALREGLRGPLAAGCTACEPTRGCAQRATPLSLAQCGCTESGVSTTCSLAACVGWAAWIRRRATWWRLRLSLVEHKTAPASLRKCFPEKKQ